MKLRWLLVVLGLVGLSAPLAGQWPRYPAPFAPGYGGVVVGGGFSYSRGPVRFGVGFASVSPYGYGRFAPPVWGSYSSLTVVSLYSPPPPPVVVVQPPPIILNLGLRERDPELPPVPDLPPVPPVPPVPDAPRPAPARPAAPRRDDVDLERFLDRKKETPGAEHARLMKEGREAFGEGSYGLAARRFRAAARLRPGEGEAYFLLGESLIATGKYHEASDAFLAGLAQDAEWPSAPFRPGALYGANVGDREEHRKALEEAQGRHPRDAVLLFLRGHQLWFGGERKEATALFRQALPRFGEAAIGRFLAAAGAKP